MKKSKLIFDSLQTRDRRGWLKNGNQPGDPQVAPRCGAKTRRGNGCQAPAMPNGRCRNPLLLFDLASTTSSTLGKSAHQRLVGFARGVPKGSFLILVWKDPMQSGSAKARTPALHGVLPQFSKKYTH
jgi:hypothetical protein